MFPRLVASFPSRVASWTFFGILLAAPGPVTAQTNDEIETGTQFNFSTPGARSLALGGAFVGLADDATAAYVNPAGLVQLVAPEISVEARGWTYTSLFGEKGHTPLHELTGIGIDTIDGIREGELDDSTAGLSFVSYVHTGQRWAVALTYHQLANFETSLLSQGVFVGARESSARSRPVRSRLDLEIWNVAVAGAYRLSDAFSLGLGVSFHDFTLASLTERFFVHPQSGDAVADSLTGRHFGPADFRPDQLFNTQVQNGDDTDAAFHAGFLWRIGRRLSLGGVYRDGPDFDFRAVYTNGPASPDAGEIDPTVGGEGVFNVPDVFGLGLAYRVSESIVVTFDYDHVEYSDMSDDLVNLIRIGRDEPESYRSEDADELRLGFEYQALEVKYPLSVRFGLWHDPDHKLRYVGERPLPRARFRPGEDELHVSGGLGVVFKRTQLDLAVDLSDRVDTVSVSTVVRLK